MGKNHASRMLVSILVAFGILCSDANIWVVGGADRRLDVNHIAATGNAIRVLNVTANSNIGSTWLMENTTGKRVKTRILRGTVVEGSDTVQRMMVAELTPSRSSSSRSSLYADEQSRTFTTSQKEYVVEFGPFERKKVFVNSLCIDLNRPVIGPKGYPNGVQNLYVMESPAMNRLFAEVDQRNATYQRLDPFDSWALGSGMEMDESSGKLMLAPDIYNIAVWKLLGATNWELRHELGPIPFRTLAIADDIVKAAAE